MFKAHWKRHLLVLKLNTTIFTDCTAASRRPDKNAPCDKVHARPRHDVLQVRITGQVGLFRQLEIPYVLPVAPRRHAILPPTGQPNVDCDILPAIHKQVVIHLIQPTAIDLHGPEILITAIVKAVETNFDARNDIVKTG